mmetsp:Transcript_7696/g.16340  ORF Transcript_7696/g.16340 Transcript_7696/m.16340 type:complete len:223 (+) Transcript_7696:285-953(+)
MRLGHVADVPPERSHVRDVEVQEGHVPRHGDRGPAPLVVAAAGGGVVAADDGQERRHGPRRLVDYAPFGRPGIGHRLLVRVQPQDRVGQLGDGTRSPPNVLGRDRLLDQTAHVPHHECVAVDEVRSRRRHQSVRYHSLQIVDLGLVRDSLELSGPVRQILGQDDDVLELAPHGDVVLGGDLGLVPGDLTAEPLHAIADRAPSSASFASSVSSRFRSRCRRNL